ncbi:uncharacterized protein LOC110837506 [Zootermopsis nevadensis]|uniref:Uncharacterized protein n=1 Tax=Zootermopsis nevadensis TaxID=136037 RepID=A0A067QXT9_ZOONE|nr:uncharacterized protein LOC110837506 [Zootermopsis nevadensis]KDR10963.1 hypothetical protein L798_15040 [Zootermopsis nevadensis]
MDMLMILRKNLFAFCCCKLRDDLYIEENNVSSLRSWIFCKNRSPSAVSASETDGDDFKAQAVEDKGFFFGDDVFNYQEAQGHRTSEIFEGPISDPSDLDQDDWVHCGDGSIPVCTPDETFNGEIQDDGNKWFKDLRASAKHIKILRTLRSEGENRPSLPTTVKDIEEIKPINEHREMDKWPKRLRKLVELSVVMRK